MKICLPTEKNNTHLVLFWAVRTKVYLNMDIDHVTDSLIANVEETREEKGEKANWKHLFLFVGGMWLTMRQCIVNMHGNAQKSLSYFDRNQTVLLIHPTMMMALPTQMSKDLVKAKIWL